jgi:hypothetical protein
VLIKAFVFCRTSEGTGKEESQMGATFERIVIDPETGIEAFLQQLSGNVTTEDLEAVADQLDADLLLISQKTDCPQIKYSSILVLNNPDIKVNWTKMGPRSAQTMKHPLFGVVVIVGVHPIILFWARMLAKMAGITIVHAASKEEAFHFVTEMTKLKAYAR